MNADIKGALQQINKSYKAFVHNGKRMTKVDVQTVLEYGLRKGYVHTGQITDDEIDKLLNQTFVCKGCTHELPNSYSMRTDGYCYLCDPAITLAECVSDEPIK